MKWVVFGVVSLGWIGACWFFGSMVGGSAGGSRGSIAAQECAKRVIAEGRAADFFVARDSEECRAAARVALREAAAPAERKGLLIGLLPVLLIGGILMLRSRT